MHHALGIQEILLNIFGHCYGRSVDLKSLAQTCHTFKDPALDILWDTLHDLSPLARCLPEISYLLSQNQNINSLRYSFRRQLTQNDWDTLHGYTRRIRSLIIHNVDGLSRKTALMLFTTRDPLLPNLRYLYLDYYHDMLHLLLHPLPSLTFLDIELYEHQAFHRSLKSVAKTSPNLKELIISNNYYSTADVNRIYPNFICQWRNLNTVDCLEFPLDMNTLLHMSRMPTLTKLGFTLDTMLPDQIAPSELPLIFPNLAELAISCKFLHPISSLLSKSRLSVVTDLYFDMGNCPSKPDFSSVLASVQTSCVDQVIQELSFFNCPGDSSTPSSRTVLGLGDLRPCMAFSNLRVMRINMEWQVGLTDSELLTLTSVWPRLECLAINEVWGWGTLGGMTPNGLLQLLQTCRSLWNIILAVDTRGYTESPPSSAFLELTFPSEISIDIVDSSIEAESVPAIAAFFAGIASRSTNLTLDAWRCWGIGNVPHEDVCWSRWRDVIRRVDDVVEQLAVF